MAPPAGLRPWVGAALVAVPALWFGGDYIGSGSPFTGGHLARISKQAVEIQRGGGYPPLVVLGRAAELVPAVLLAGVPVALVAGVRRRDPLLLALCAGALVWTTEVAVMSALGYPGIQRFLFPAAAAAGIAGAAGLTMLVRLPRPRATQAVLAGVVLAAVAGSALTVAPATRSETARIEHRADVDQSLVALMERVDPQTFSGRRHVAVEGIETTALAWRLGVSPVSFRGPHVPGLALEVRDVPWVRLQRRVARHHLEVRQVVRKRGAQPRVGDALAQANRRRAIATPSAQTPARPAARKRASHGNPLPSAGSVEAWRGAGAAGSGGWPASLTAKVRASTVATRLRSGARTSMRPPPRAHAQADSPRGRCRARACRGRCRPRSGPPCPARG